MKALRATWNFAGGLAVAVLMTINLGGPTACLTPGPYACSSDTQCVQDGLQGSCSADLGYCRFPDGDCPSGGRWSRHAGDGMASQCAPTQQTGTTSSDAEDPDTGIASETGGEAETTDSEGDSPLAELLFEATFDDAPRVPSDDFITDGMYDSRSWAGHVYPYEPLVTQEEIVRSGSRALLLHMERENTDWSSNNSPRITLTRTSGGVAGGGVLELDTHYWFGISVFIPTTWVDDEPENPDNLWNIAGDGRFSPRSPPLRVGVVEGSFEIRVLTDGECDDCDYPFNEVRFDGGSLNKGEWTDFVVHAKINITDAHYEVWKNDEQIADHQGSGGYDYPDGAGVGGPDDAAHISLGLAKSEWLKQPTKVDERTVYIDEVRIARGENGYSVVNPPGSRP